MYYVFMFLSLPILVGIAYYFNRPKMRKSTPFILLKSTLEGIVSYCLVMVFFLYGFFPSPLYVIISIFVALVAAYFVLFGKKQYMNDMDVQMETSKNTIILFTSSILFLFVLLTIFRYLNPFIQVTLALGITALLNWGLYYFKDKMVLFYDNFSVRNLRTVSFLPIKLFFGITLFLLAVLFFNFPSAEVNNLLNLEHHSDFFSFFEAPVDITNRYDSELLVEIEKDIDDRHLEANIQVEEDYIFIYYYSKVIIVDKENTVVLYDGSILENDTDIEVPNQFVETNETEIVSTCGATDECEVEQIVYTHKGVTYEHYDKITKFTSLDYEHTTTAIYDENNILLFGSKKADSLFKPNLKEPFWDYSMFDAEVTDIDNSNGSLVYVVTTSKGDKNYFEVYEIVEKEIGLELPFYTYFNFGSLVMVSIFALIPITTYEAFTQEISFDTRVLGKKNTNI